MPCFFFLCSVDHRNLHVLTHSFPTRRSSDLPSIFMSWRHRGVRPPCARGACVRGTRAQSHRTGLFDSTLCSTVLREGGLGRHGHASGGIGGPKLYPIALRRPASREERSVEPRDRKSTRLNSSN